MTLAAGGGLETKQAPKAYSLLFTLYKNDRYPEFISGS